MKCIKCGADCIEGRFCPVCGTKQPAKGPQTGTFNPGGGVGNTNGKMKKIAAGVGIGVLMAGICFLVVSLLMQPTINLNKYMSINVEGYHTVGVATCVFNEGKFVKDYGKKLAEKTGSKPGFLESLFGGESSDASGAAYSFLSECVDWECSPESGLSNGDKVVLKWKCDDKVAKEKYGYKLKYSDIKESVSGLEEGEVFDPFDGIKVTFEGISPHGTARWDGEASNEAGQNFSYYFEMSDDLKNGDEVILHVDGDPDEVTRSCIESYGLIPSPLQKTYKVEGLPSYIQSMDDISEDSLNAMIKQGKDVYLADNSTNLGESEEIRDITYIGTYLLTKKDSDSDSYDSENKLYLVYKVIMDLSYTSYSNETFEDSQPVYWYTEYSDVSADPSGKTDISLTDYSTPGESFNVDSGIGEYWYYTGYPTLEELEKYVVTGQGDIYDSSKDIDESGSEKAKKKKKAATTEKKGESSDSNEGIIFPNSSEEILSDEQVSALSDNDLRYAINEIFARNGYIFKTESLQKYYEKYDWYEGKAGEGEFSESVFNDVEKTNLEKLTKERDRRK